MNRSLALAQLHRASRSVVHPKKQTKVQPEEAAGQQQDVFKILETTASSSGSSRSNQSLGKMMRFVTKMYSSGEGTSGDRLSLMENES